MQEAVDREMSTWSKYGAVEVAPPEKVYRPVGCIECRETGYMGRVGLYELLMATDEVKPVVTERMEVEDLRRLAMKDGMRTLRLSGALQIGRGLTTIEEVLRVVPAASTH